MSLANTEQLTGSATLAPAQDMPATASREIELRSDAVAQGLYELRCFLSDLSFKLQGKSGLEPSKVTEEGSPTVSNFASTMSDILTSQEVALHDIRSIADGLKQFI